MKEKIGFYSYVDLTLLTNAEIFDIITIVNRGVVQLVARDVWEHAGTFRFLIFQTLETP